MGGCRRGLGTMLWSWAWAFDVVMVSEAAILQIKGRPEILSCQTFSPQAGDVG